MSGVLINLIIQIISGAVGGNVAAGAAKNIDLGTLGNTTVTESVPGESLIVTDFYSAPSDPLMLGMSNFDEPFQDGDVIDLVFATPVNSVGLFVVTVILRMQSDTLSS